MSQTPTQVQRRCSVVCPRLLTSCLGAALASVCRPSLALLSSVSINRSPTTTPLPTLYECPRLSHCSLRLSNTDTQALCLCHNIFSPSFYPFLVLVVETLKEEVGREGLHGNGRGEKRKRKRLGAASLFIILIFSCLSPSRLSSFLFSVVTVSAFTPHPLRLSLKSATSQRE